MILIRNLLESYDLLAY